MLTHTHTQWQLLKAAINFPCIFTFSAAEGKAVPSLPDFGTSYHVKGKRQRTCVYLISPRSDPRSLNM